MAALSRAYRDQTFFVNTITTEQHRPSSLRQTSLFVSRNLRICRAARSLSARYINRWSTSKTRIVARAWVCDRPTVWGYRAALPLHDRVNPLTVSSNCARMGCDGGTIPKRDELVRTKKKAEQKDKSSVQLYRWRNCHLTQGPLRSPIVACGMGLLYNKESVLQHLVNKTPFPEASAHIKSLKDIRVLKLTPNPAFNGKAQSVGGYIDDKCSPYICPLVGLEMNDRSVFCFLWNCGCVISERGLKLGVDNKCINCMMEYEDDDVVVLNPTEENISLMKIKLAKRKDKIKNKKNKIKQEVVVKEEPTDEITNEKTIDPLSTTYNIEHKNVNVKVEIKAENDIKSVCKTKKEQTKRLITNAEISSSSNTNCRKLEDPVYKKAKLSHSIAKDQTATNVYKSLFTSHDDDKNQTRAHWITYNPFYN